MSKLQRWIVGGSLWDIEEHEEGEWVKFSDVDELKLQVPEWVSVEDDPKRDGHYYGWFPGCVQCFTVKREKGKWMYISGFMVNITHWMPLPKPPTKGKADD